MLFIVNVVIVQCISIYFLYFVGQEWDFLLLQGDGQDIIFSGCMLEGDILFIDWLVVYSGYCGMGWWMFCKGGGVDMVFNGEDFQIVCFDEQLMEECIIFEGLVENCFFWEYYCCQQWLRDWYLVMQVVLQLYGLDELFVFVFSVEVVVFV